MDINDIKALLEAVADTDITHFELESDEFTLRIRKEKEQTTVYTESAAAASPPGLSAAQPVATAGTPAPATATEETMEEPEEETRGIEVCSPMVGTFYEAPSPDSAPFVSVGDQVEPGQTLCIIEAMKLMNEIEAEQKGKVLEVLVENGQAVEFGQPLFLLEPLE